MVVEVAASVVVEVVVEVLVEVAVEVLVEVVADVVSPACGYRQYGSRCAGHSLSTPHNSINEKTTLPDMDNNPLAPLSRGQAILAETNISCVLLAILW